MFTRLRAISRQGNCTLADASLDEIALPLRQDYIVHTHSIAHAS